MPFLSGAMYVLCEAVYLLLNIMWLALVARAILSWFVFDEEAWYIRLLDAICAPAVFPFRALFDRFGWFESLPIDLAPLFAMIALSFITSLLPVVPY